MWTYRKSLLVHFPVFGPLLSGAILGQIDISSLVVTHSLKCEMQKACQEYVSACFAYEKVPCTCKSTLGCSQMLTFPREPFPELELKRPLKRLAARFLQRSVPIIDPGREPLNWDTES